MELATAVDIVDSARGAAKGYVCGLPVVRVGRRAQRRDPMPFAPSAWAGFVRRQQLAHAQTGLGYRH
jgi:hypothetical protein